MPRDVIHGDGSFIFTRIKRDLAFRITIYLSLPLISLHFFHWKVTTLGLVYPTLGQVREGFMLGIVMFIITAFYNHLEKETTEWNVKRDAIWALYFIFVNAFFEELFYRGWMQTIIFSHIPFFPANLLLSAFIFGIQHRLFFGSSVRNCVFYGVGGIFLGFVFYTSGNLMEVWTIHAFADLGLGGGKYLFHWGEWKDIPGKNIEPT